MARRITMAWPLLNGFKVKPHTSMTFTLVLILMEGLPKECHSWSDLLDGAGTINPFINNMKKMTLLNAVTLLTSMNLIISHALFEDFSCGFKLPYHYWHSNSL